MSVESEPTTMMQSNGEQPSAQDTLDSDRIATTETLGNEIATVISEATRLQRFEYITGEVAEYGVSSRDHAHFRLVHESGTIHCVIFDFRRTTLTTNITNGMQIAVTGDLSFYAQENRCEIEVEEVVPIGEDGSHPFYEVILARLWIAIVAVLVIVLGLGGYFILL